MNEWVKIKGYNYSINKEGNVRNDKTQRILKPRISTSGYYVLHLFDSKKKTAYIHRLLADAFIPNPDNLPQIDHIDGNKLNNQLSNLRWVSVSENCLGYGHEQRIEKRKIKVIAQHLYGCEWIFNSRKETADYFECNTTKIKYNHRYTRGKCKGWIFHKVEDIV